VPIPYREILLTSSIMDAIFDQLSAKSHSGVEFQVQDQTRLPITTSH